MKNSRVFLIWFMVLFMGVMGWAQDQQVKNSLSLKLGYGLPSSSTFNKEYRTAVNAQVKDTAEYLQGLGLSSSYLPMHKLSGLILMGAELEIKATQQFWLVLGSEFWTRRLNTALDVAGKINEVSYTIQDEGKINFYVIPILATVRINLPFEIARIYLGGGLGYYLSYLTIKQQWNWLENSEAVDTDLRDLRASGQALLPHANLGGEIKLSDQISASVDLRYPFGSIKSFKVKKDTLDSQNVGQKLIFTDPDGHEQQFKWELSGPVIGAQLKFKF